MKVAVQFFGHLRTYADCWESINKFILKKYDCDVFMHTWDTLDSHTKTWHNFRVDEEEKSVMELEEELKWIYSLKSLKIEKQQLVDEGNLVCQGKEISIFGLHAMLYSMREVNKMREAYQREKNVKYDYVLVVRPDVKLLSNFNFLDYANPQNTVPEILNNSIYLAGFYKFKYLLNDFRFIGASDVLFFGIPLVVSKLYDHVDDIFNQIKKIETSRYGPEYSFIYCMENLGIKPKLINYLFNEKCQIIRGKCINGDAGTIPVAKKSNRKKFMERIFHVK